MSSADAGYSSNLSDNDDEDNDIPNPLIPLFPVVAPILAPAFIDSPPKPIDSSLEFTEEELQDFWEAHEKRKENARKKNEEGHNDEFFKAHSFDLYIPAGLEVYDFPQMNDLFSKMISKFVQIPLNKLIIIKRLSQTFNKNLIGLSFIGDTATMIAYADHHLIDQLIKLLQTQNIEFHGLSKEEIQALF